MLLFVTVLQMRKSLVKHCYISTDYSDLFTLFYFIYY